MIPIVLLHRADADREALAAWLDGEGYEVTCSESASDLEFQLRRARPGAGPQVAVVQEQALARQVEFACLGNLPLVLLGTERPLEPPEGTVRLTEPCRFEDLVEAIQRVRSLPPRPLEEPRRGSRVSGRRSRAGEATASRVSGPQPSDLLLRGLAHAISNPLAAASGWLQFVELDADPSPGARRALRHVRSELERIDRMTQALSLIGGRPSMLGLEIDLFEVARRFVDRAQEHELGVATHLPATQDEGALFTADPAEVYLFFDLLLDSYVADMERVGGLDLSIQRNGDGDLHLLLADRGGIMPAGVDPSDLAVLLQNMRHARALALSVGHELIVGRLGGSLNIATEAGGTGTRLEILIPASQEEHEEGAQESSLG